MPQVPNGAAPAGALPGADPVRAALSEAGLVAQATPADPVPEILGGAEPIPEVLKDADADTAADTAAEDTR